MWILVTISWLYFFWVYKKTHPPSGIFSESVSLMDTLGFTPPKLWLDWVTPSFGDRCSSIVNYKCFIMSVKKSFNVAKCYATKSDTAKYPFILHLSVQVEIPEYNAKGEVLGHAKATKYIRKGSNFEIAENEELVVEINKYKVQSFDTEWTDEETGEQRQGVEHWLSPTIEL